MDNFNKKFSIYKNLIYESEFWTWSLRPEQITLGSSVLALKRECEHFKDMTENEAKDLKLIVKVIETSLKSAFLYDKINYLMLMMIDNQVHFHVFPRYKNSRTIFELKWSDDDWPKQINLSRCIPKDNYDPELIIDAIVKKIKCN